MTTYLITGGAGSLGRELVREIHARDPRDIVRVIDINEAGLAMLKHPTRRIYGDICNQDRIDFAMRHVDICIHAAAMKNLEIAEYNIDAVLRTNVQGTLSVARAAMKRQVSHAIFISSDKAVHPTTAYGASKAMGEKTWFWAHRIQNRSTFSILRSGNFMESRGNVFEVWDEQVRNGQPITITDPEMERYFVKTADVAKLILDMPRWVQGGEIVIPVMQSRKIIDLAEEMHPGHERRIIGARPGEKITEELTDSHERVVRVEKDCKVIERGP